MQSAFVLILVFIGGGLGSICRYAVWLGLRPWQEKFPWATLTANGLACIVLGLLLGWQAQALLSDQRRLLLVTGFCGGFSTYSTFTAETWGLWQNGQAGAAVANVLINLAVCVVCLLVGLRLGSA
ncbi:MAG: fluoride efflux transporter CrcB [Bacteroidetes bacterium]|nr:MAG: fluoride efflux transporter CrcB [Bacteroidota bacterium]